MIISCTYNVYPSGSGEVISGRVLDGKGMPVAGASVTAVGSGISYPAVTTNARGIYAVTKVPSATTYTLTASSAGLPTTSITVTTGTSTSYASTSGNVWGARYPHGPLAPLLTLTKSCDVSGAIPGTTLTYSLAYGNSGNTTATNVLLTDMLPAEMRYVPYSASGGGSFNNGTLSWSFSDPGG